MRRDNRRETIFIPLSVMDHSIPVAERKKLALELPQLSANWLVVVATTIVVGFSAICVSVLLSMRRGDIDLAAQTSSNLAAAIHADIVRNVELYDLSLRNAIDGLRSPEIEKLTKPLRQLVLFDRTSTARHFGPIKVYDQAGDVTLDSTTLTPRPENISGQENFEIHSKQSSDALFISKPLRTESGEYVIFVSHRISGNDGSFAGMVAGSIRLSYFSSMFRRLKMDSQDVLTLFRRDGTILTRNPPDASAMGRNLPNTSRFRDPEIMEGSFRAVAAIDGVDRQYVWKGGTVPLVVVAGKSMDDILSRWRGKAFLIGAAMLGLAVLSMGFTLLLAAEMKRRTIAEGKLAALANTDALTGLSNRRSFDKIMLAEWSRARRERTPLSLLMIDADHFKGFNDTFGHQAGDIVLASIAACIADNARRPLDCGARYGGEEFAVLLPNVRSEDAMQIAESIRFGVSGLPSEFRSITVSIGVATLIPVDGIDHRDLIYAADVALYQAKSRGRNQTVAQQSRQDVLAA